MTAFDQLIWMSRSSIYRIKKYSATYRKQPNTNKRPIKKYHLHIVTSFISLQCFEHIYLLLQSQIPFLNFGLELQ